MKLAKTRRHQLNRAFSESGYKSKAQFAEDKFTKINISPDYFRQLLRGDRNIGETKAREIEQCLKVDKYWLDGGIENFTYTDKKESNEGKSQLDLEAAKFALEAFREFVGWTERDALGVELELKLFDLLYRYYILSREEGDNIAPDSSEVAKFIRLNQ